MTPPTESRLTRTQTSTSTSGATTSRTRYTSSQAAATFVIGGIRRLGRLRAHAAAAWRRTSETISPAGWVLVVGTLLGLGLGLAFGWVELVGAGIVAGVLLLLCLPFLFGARAYDVSLSLAHERVVAGTEVTGTLSVRNTARGIALPGTVDLPIGDGLIEVQVPLLRGDARHAEEVRIPTHRRGIITIGPAHSVRGDPLGALRREATWPQTHTLFVHPVTVALPPTSTGFVRDLEGNPSTLVVDADLSFHALREYVPGDAPRQIHWKSTAKTGTLMVRQYEESRRSRMVVVLATGEDEYAGEADFELAVSAAASVGLRGIRDGRDVQVVVGGEVPELARRAVRSIQELPTVTTRTLLDALAGVGRAAGVTRLREAARLAGESHPDVSIAFLVCGPTLTARTLQSIALSFAPGVGVIAVVCDPEARPGVRLLGDIAVVTIGLLDDLRQLLSRGVRS